MEPTACTDDSPEAIQRVERIRACLRVAAANAAKVASTNAANAANAAKVAATSATNAAKSAKAASAAARATEVAVRTTEGLLAYDFQYEQNESMLHEQKEVMLQKRSWFQEGPVDLFGVKIQTCFC